MKTSDEFLRHALEMLNPLGDLRARRMFGGYGIYCGEIFFGLIADHTLYLKVDAENRADFEHAGSEPFQYSRRSKRTTLNFYRAPEESLESPQLMLPWSRSALACALRARTRKVAGGTRRPATASGAGRATPLKTGRKTRTPKRRKTRG